MPGRWRGLYYPVSAELHVADLQNTVLVRRVGISQCLAAVIYFIEGELCAHYRCPGIYIIKISDCHGPALSRIDGFIGKHSLWREDEQINSDKDD